MFLCSLFFSAHNGFGYHRAHLERTRIENIFREHFSRTYLFCANPLCWSVRNRASRFNRWGVSKELTCSTWTEFRIGLSSKNHCGLFRSLGLFQSYRTTQTVLTVSVQTIINRMRHLSKQSASSSERKTVGFLLGLSLDLSRSLSTSLQICSNNSLTVGFFAAADLVDNSCLSRPAHPEEVFIEHCSTHCSEKDTHCVLHSPLYHTAMFII